MQVMETERYLYLVTEYASKGEIFGKTVFMREGEREWERGSEGRIDGGREGERERERDTCTIHPHTLRPLTQQLSQQKL